ncbi:LTA synthase family protein [Alkalicoccobacillus murimartini]|uniref:Lipoteichoic acid synthase n=1 Tax=Alkalicoccobacillus murimartini TaxID=171685 RepID=A0ABT9YH32_9BACI|nr:LTA synthase family protein [Alkalicoccobacillus murimartini]MDQ0207169.1 lipoteichoic acid synthase [Alkalicoccobacillus murimartini]
MKTLRSSKGGFFLLAVILLWIKTYLSYKIEFNLGVKGMLQEFLLLINPISAAVILFGFALFAKGKRACWWIFGMSTAMTIVLYSNIMFYRFFDDFLTLPNLLQTDNVGNMSEGIFSTMYGYDVLYFIDLAVLLLWLLRNKAISETKFRKSLASTAIIAGIAIFTLNLTLAEIDRPQLLTRTFDRNYIVKYLGLYNYTVYDGVQTAQMESQRAYASSDDLSNAKHYTSSHYAEPDEKMFGKGQGKNIIKIHLESFQSFLIDYELNGEEVTPFLNDLAHGGEDMNYFDNFFHQTGQGKTADAELILDNSMFGLPTGAAFVTKGQNTYQSLPAILNSEENYTSAILHGDYKSFWNRDQIYKQFGIDTFFDASSYNMDDESVVNLGLKDKPFFEESIPMLQSLEQPFYAHLLTLTNHYPFILDEEDATLDRGTTGDKTVDGYFQTARYLDEAVEEFFGELKEAGLYDDSIIMIYGDHQGISENHNRAMAEVLGTEITPYQNAQNQRVPLMIRVPGEEGGVNHTYGGEIDVMPTLLHLQGIDHKKYMTFGTDLFSDEHDETVAFRDGGFVSPEYTNVGGTVYDTDSGEEVEPNEETARLKEKVDEQLQLSDEVLYQDLLRFHEIPGFEPTDPKQYDYGENDARGTDQEDN